MKLIGCAVAAMVSTAALAGPIGQFTEHGDIGQPASPGTASYDPATRTYRITGVGRNMWADHDEFHYAWKRMSGDVVADTRLGFVTPAPAPGAGGFLHRKGGIVLRQDLDPELGLCRRAANGQPADVAPIPGSKRRPDAADLGQYAAARCSAARKDRRLCLSVRPR